MPEDRGLLLALVGFTTRMAFPERWPVDPLESLLAAWEIAICLERSSTMVS